MMILNEAIEKYTRNAEYERTHGNLQGCLDFKQLAEYRQLAWWLNDYKKLLGAIDDIHSLHKSRRICLLKGEEVLSLVEKSFTST